MGLVSFDMFPTCLYRCQYLIDAQTLTWLALVKDIRQRRGGDDDRDPIQLWTGEWHSIHALGRETSLAAIPIIDANGRGWMPGARCTLTAQNAC